MRLTEALRATTFSTPRVDRDALDGLPTLIRGHVENPPARSVQLPDPRHLPPVLADAIRAYLDADHTLNTETTNLRRAGADPAQSSEKVAALRTERDHAWIHVRTVLVEQHDALLAATRAARTEATERLGRAYGELRAAAEAYTAACATEAAIANHSLRTEGSTVPALTALTTALDGQSFDSPDGLRGAIHEINNTENTRR